jgi:hypothetical protein
MHHLVKPGFFTSGIVTGPESLREVSHDEVRGFVVIQLPVMVYSYGLASKYRTLFRPVRASGLKECERIVDW